MSHYDVFLVIFAALAICGAYHKGCRDTWRKADEIAQVEPLLPPKREPQPIDLRSSPFHWPELSPASDSEQQEQML